MMHILQSALLEDLLLKKLTLSSRSLTEGDRLASVNTSKRS